MKTLAAPAEIKRKRRDAEIYYLAKLELSIPSAKTYYFSDATRTAIGQTWRAYVESFGALSGVMNSTDGDGAPETFSIRFFNNRPIDGKARLWDLVRTPLNTIGTYEFTGARVTLYQLFAGLTLGAEVPLGRFYIEDNPVITDTIIEFRMSSLELFIKNKMKIRQLTTSDWPLADPDDVGKDIPVGFGIVPNVVALAAIAGGRTTITRAITATSHNVGDWLAVSQHTPTLPTSGVGYIDDEVLSWSAKRTTAGIPEVRIAQRGLNGTTRAPHAAGATLAELRSGPKAYGYVVCENPAGYVHRNALNVRVEGVLQEQATIELAATFPNMPGRSFLMIWFRALPILRRQVNLAIDDQITVGDNIGVSSPSLTTIKVGAITQGRVGVNNPNNTQLQGLWYSVSTEANFDPIGGTLTTTLYTGTVVIGLVTAFEYRLYVGNPPELIGHNLIGPYGSHSFQYSRNDESLRAVKVRLEWRARDANTQQEMYVLATADATGPIQVNKTGNASRSGNIRLTGNSTADVIIEGQVTCDLHGIEDDGAGTISGTPGLLLRNPTDITKFIHLVLFPGIVAGDLGATWPVTRALHAGGNYRWDFLLTTHTYEDLRPKLAEQARCALYAEADKLEYKFLEFNAPSRVFVGEFPVTPRGSLGSYTSRAQLLRVGYIAPAIAIAAGQVTIDYLKDIAEASPTEISRTPVDEIRNSITCYAARDYRKSGSLGEMYTISRLHEDLSGFPDRITDDLELDFVRDAATAAKVAGVVLTQRRRQRIGLEAIVPWNALVVEKYDLVSFANHPLLTAHGGTALSFRVVEKEYLLNTDDEACTRLKGIEANP